MLNINKIHRYVKSIYSLLLFIHTVNKMYTLHYVITNRDVTYTNHMTDKNLSNMT